MPHTHAQNGSHLPRARWVLSTLLGSALVLLASPALANCPLPDGGDHGGEDVFINGDCTWSGTHTNIGSLIVDDQAVLQVAPESTLTIDARSIEIRGVLSADEAGFAGGAGGDRGRGGRGGAGGRAGSDGADTTECGRPGIDFNAGGGGGGAASFHGQGGPGGHGSDANDDGCSGAPGGGAASAVGNPELYRAGAGGGGGGGAGGPRFTPGLPGERGGGHIIITARTLRVDGRISANGGRGGNGGTSPDFFHGGGGGGGAAGGAIQITTTYLIGAGNIEARGGQGGQGGQGDTRGDNSYTGEGGSGGGGGIVVIDYASRVAFTGNCLATGGAVGPGTNTNSTGLIVAGTDGLCVETQVNGAPTANAGGPYITIEGRPATVTGIASEDPDGDELTYEWDCDNNGSFEQQGQTVECSYANDGTYTIRLRVRDTEGETDTAETQVVVSEGPPIADLTGPEQVDEGATVTLDASASDAGADTLVTFEWDFDYDGTFEAQETTNSPTFERDFCDNGVYNVAVRVIDDGGSSALAIHRVRVQNVTPTIDSTPTLEAVEGQEYTYQAQATDPGCDDLTYALAIRPEGMEVSETGLITFTPTFRDASLGCTPVRLLVSDDDFGRAPQEWELCVEFSDMDEDGLPDTWETEFGLDPNTPDADQDPDGDGRTNLEEFENDLSPLDFDGPTAPRLSAPANDGEVNIVTPELITFRAQSPLNAPMTYDFEIYSFVDSADQLQPDLLLASAEDIDPGPDAATISWTVPEDATLADHDSYCWRVRATDDLVNGPWSDLWCFFVNLENDPPTEPTPILPANNSEIDSDSPTLTVNNCTDIDGDPTNYTFILYRGDSTAPFASLSGAPAGEDGMTSWTVEEDLEENETYCWRVQCRDNQGATSEFSNLSCFTVNQTNEIPECPVITSPRPTGDSLRAEITTESVTLTARAVIDPENDPVVYTFDVSDSLNFENILATTEIPDDRGADVEWTPDVPWEDNTSYFARIFASDGNGTCENPRVIEFFMNFANDPPTAPELRSPIKNTITSSDLPTLTIGNAVDPDGDPLTYQFQVFDEAADVDSPGSEIFVRAGVAETPEITQVKVDELLSGTYYWRARANDGNGEGPWSELESFIIQDNEKVPEGPGGGGTNNDTTTTGPTTGDPGDGGDDSGGDDEGCGCVQAPAKPAPLQPGALAALALLAGAVLARRRRR